MYNMSIYQQQAMRTIGVYTPRIYSSEEQMMLCAALGIAGESGEFADNIKKMFFHGKDVTNEKMQLELGDILWYIALFCEAKGWSMNALLSMNIRKLEQRYPNGFSHAASNNRIV